MCIESHSKARVHSKALSAQHCSRFVFCSIANADLAVRPAHIVLLQGKCAVEPTGKQARVQTLKHKDIY